MNSTLERFRFLNPYLASAAIACALATAWLAMGTWLISIDQTNEKLQKDARVYFDMALDPQPFYGTSFREPLFPRFLRCAIQMSGAQAESHRERVVRQTTGAAGLLMILAAAALAWRVAGPMAAALAAWLLALSAYVTFFSISGLRETTSGLLWTLLIWLLLWEARDTGRRVVKLLATGVVCAALPLIRQESIVVIALVLIVWVGIHIARSNRHAAATRPRARRSRPTVEWEELNANRRPVAVENRSYGGLFSEAAVYLLAGILALAPFLIAQQRAGGSQRLQGSAHATYFRNHEFVDQPGHLTREQVLANPYGGQPITVGEYMFGLHTPAEVAARFAKGYWIALVENVPLLFGWLHYQTSVLTKNYGALLWLIGAGWSLVRWKQSGLMVAAVFLIELPFVFFVSMNMVLPEGTALGVELRYSFPPTPLIAVLAAIGLVETCRWVYRQILEASSPPERNGCAIPSDQAQTER